MAKIIEDHELVDIVQRTVNDAEIDDLDTYLRFLQDLATLLTNYFGGEVTGASLDNDEDEPHYYVAVCHTEEVPEGGGVWARYDTDVDWSDPEEKEC